MGNIGLDTLFLIVGIACLVVLQLLRAMLSATFPKVSANIVDTPSESDTGGHDLYDAITEKLVGIGFEGPIWVANEYKPTGASVVKVHAVYRNREENVVAWFAPPTDIDKPNDPLTYFTSALDDDRYAVSQISDPYFAVVGDRKTPAQTIAPMDLETAVEEHRKFVAKLAGRRRIGGTSKREIIHFAGAHQTDIGNRLLAAGKLHEEAGTARPTITFGVKILWAFLRRPKSGVKTQQPVPPERLAHLDRLVVAAARRAPAQSTQWWLMLFSALASLGIGWPIFGLQTSAVLVGVIAFHEFGHWFAMKAAGYENPHITLLPLLGGVTIGHETDPSAAKRAWVSLAGPLPGVILGWTLLYYANTMALGDVAAEWVSMTAMMLLIVNYLNVLPIPPLDGSHVVRALLPPKWITLHVLVVLIGTGLGIYVAFLLDFWILAIIAAIQLFSIRNIWLSGKTIRRFCKEGPPAGTDNSQRLLWLFKQGKDSADAPVAAASRIAAAREVLSQSDMRPMAWAQGLLVSIVFLAMVGVPAAGIALVAESMKVLDIDPDTAGYYEQIELRNEELILAAERMTVEALAADLQPDELPKAATAIQIDAANARLDRTLPDSLTRFYAVYNGLPELGISPLEEIGPVNGNPEVLEIIRYMVYEDELQLYTNDGDILDVTLGDISNWLVIGSAADQYSAVLMSPEYSPALESNAIVRIVDGGATIYADVTGMLRDFWVSDSMIAVYDEFYGQAFNIALSKYSDTNIESLLGEFPKPPFIYRILPLFESWPEPAGEQELVELEGRLGQALPADYRYVLSSHNGFPPLLLLSTSEVDSADRIDEETLSYFLDAVQSVDIDSKFTLDSLSACWVIGGYSYDEGDTDIPSVAPSLLWCPEQDETSRYVSLGQRAVHPTLTSVARTAVAQTKTLY